MNVATSFAEARSAAQVARAGKGSIGLVPTMGFLHEGHLALLARARRECRTVIMSLYINPRQFNRSADFQSYPADFERDRRLAAEAGVDVLFAPSTKEVYPPGGSISIEPGAVAEYMEGTHRPGHFQGVALVVAKLLAGLGAHRAYFGRKDAQQLAVITRMARDLHFPIEIVGCPTMREMDGLALSSRNVLIPNTHRKRALSIINGLERAGRAVEDGERSADRLRHLVMGSERHQHQVNWEYVELADQQDSSLLASLDRPAFLAVAATVAGVRLIDNLFFDRHSGGFSVDRGVRLRAPSLLYR